MQDCWYFLPVLSVIDHVRIIQQYLIVVKFLLFSWINYQSITRIWNFSVVWWLFWVWRKVLLVFVSSEDPVISELNVTIIIIVLTGICWPNAKGSQVCLKGRSTMQQFTVTKGKIRGGRYFADVLCNVGQEDCFFYYKERSTDHGDQRKHKTTFSTRFQLVNITLE